MRTRVSMLFAAAILAPAIAAASVIDLRTLPGNFNQQAWGQPNTTIYAQSLVADATFLSEIRFLADPEIGGLVFSVLITGDRADGGGGLGFAPDFADIRFDSGTQSIADGSGLTEVTAFPNINVAVGERLFLVLNSYTHPTSGRGAVWATQFNGPTDHYVPGEFVFLNTFAAGPLIGLNAFNFSHRFENNEDLAIYADFNNQAVIPEPGTLVLLGGGLVAWSRRRSARRT